jgi:fucose 4-O-acetylase-like acetyltransferase
VDVARGVLVICVIGIHAARTAEKGFLYHPPQWFLIAGTGRILQFTVPAFLLISVFLGTRSLLGGTPIPLYLTSRLRSTLWPFLVWSFIVAAYIVWRRPYMHLPSALLWVWSGYRDYHLYFLRVLLQISLALPLLMPLARRPRSLGWTVLTAALATGAVFLGNRYWWEIRDAASYGFWYLPSVALGLWLGSQRDAAIVSRYRSAALAVALLALANYLPLAVRREAGVDVHHWMLPVSWWVYSAAAGLALLGYCELWSHQATSHGFECLRQLGRRSLPIYLLHPLPLLVLNSVLYRLHWGGLGGYSPSGVVQMVMLVLFSLSCSLAAAVVLERLKLSGWIFGR